MHHFTPWSALAGGALIGLAASLLLIALGISRASPRSLVATLTFIASGIVAVLLTRLLGGGA